jgi:hypothetical protein
VKCVTALLPMPSSLEALLLNYLKHHWKENPGKLLFPAPRKEGFLAFGGLAFRHGLATELAESEPITVLQAQNAACRRENDA